MGHGTRQILSPRKVVARECPIDNVYTNLGSPRSDYAAMNARRC